MSLHLRPSLSFEPRWSFAPPMVSGANSGFFWDPDYYLSNTLPEGQGQSSANLAVGSGTPTIVSANNHSMLRCPAGAYLASSAVVAGSTTKRYLAGWLRFTAASAGANTLLAAQWGGSVATTSAILYWDGSDINAFYTDGAGAARNWKFHGIAFPTTPKWFELMIDTTQVTDTDRAKVAVDLVDQAATTTASGYATVNNASLAFQMCRQATSTNANVTDIGFTCAFPVIPNTAERAMLRAYKPNA